MIWINCRHVWDMYYRQLKMACMFAKIVKELKVENFELVCTSWSDATHY